MTDWRFDEPVPKTRPWSQFAGRGRRLTDAGMAAESYVHYALASAERLAIVTSLCCNGPATAPHLARRLGKNVQAMHHILNALTRVHLLARSQVQPLHGPSPHSHTRRPVYFEAEIDARRWLFRYALVTRRIFNWNDADWSLSHDVGDDPVLAIQHHVRPEFVRPTAITIARQLRWFGPLATCYLVPAVGLPHGLVDWYVHRWAAAGLLARHQRPAESPLQFHLVPRWSFTPEGLDILGRHVSAITRAARDAGYLPRSEDLRFPNQDESLFGAVAPDADDILREREALEKLEREFGVHH